MDADGYTRLRVRELYSNPWLSVEAHDIVHPNGVPGEHLLVRTPAPAAVVVEDGDELLFTIQPRFAARNRPIEIVKGGRDPGEDALQCAQRELHEELGVVAGAWIPLGRLYEIPSIVQEPIALFLARDLRFEAARQQAEENIEMLRLSIGAALKAAVSGAIDDAITVAALFRYAAFAGALGELGARAE
jgi:ADP-ribose pyrophosphatase